MNQNKNFVASLIASVAAFVVIPYAFVMLYGVFQVLSVGISFYTIVTLLFALDVLAIFVLETIALVLTKKGKEMGKAYNIVVMVLNALIAVLTLIMLIYQLIQFGSFNFDVFLTLCTGTLPIVFVGAANGTAFGFKLFNMLKK